VAEFGMLLRESAYRGQASFDSVRARAKTFLGDDKEGYRAEFVRLVDRAASLKDSGQ
jgi:Ca-activated chloride channel family protein